MMNSFVSNGDEMCVQRQKLGAVLFDLDGVVTDTNRLHYRAWHEIADEEGLHFDETINKKLLGISREASLDIILEENGVEWNSDKKAFWCVKKNDIYKKSLASLSENDILPGVKELLSELKERKIPAALASSSRNAPMIIERLHLSEYFCAIADASRIQNAKPAPDLFLEAARLVGISPVNCVGIEDAVSGVRALKAANMKSVGITTTVALPEADIQLSSTAELSYETLCALMESASETKQIP